VNEVIIILRGPFWLICSETADSNGQLSFDMSSACVISMGVDNITERTPSHKSCWPAIATEYLSLPWNYYPRGRLEIRRGKAIVFANPLCLQYPFLLDDIRYAFNIPNDVEINVKSDNSAHYASANM